MVLKFQRNCKPAAGFIKYFLFKWYFPLGLMSGFTASARFEDGFEVSQNKQTSKTWPKALVMK